MPQKSQYIQAPITKAKLIKGFKDGISFLGVDSVQSSLNDNKVYDSSYIETLLKTSSVNLMAESEILTIKEVFVDGNVKILSDPRVGLGAEGYVEVNNDTNLPFKNYTVVRPRSRETDVNMRYAFNTVTGQQYTVSFWAARNSPANGRESKLTVNIIDAAQANFVAINTFNLTEEFTRYSITFTATSNVSFINFGGNYTWAGDAGTNYIGRGFINYTRAVLNGATVTNDNYVAGDLNDPYKSYILSQPEFDTQKLTMTLPNSTSYIRYKLSSNDYLRKLWTTSTNSSTNIVVKFVAKVSGSVIAKFTNNSSDLASNASTPSTNMTLTDSGGQYNTYTFNGTLGELMASNPSTYYLSFFNNGSVSSSVDLIDVSISLAGDYVPTLYGWYKAVYDSDYISTIFTAQRGIFRGGLKYSGLQVNTGATAAPYEPVRSLVFQPNVSGEQTTTWNPTNPFEVIMMQSHMNGGMDYVYMNVISSTPKIVGVGSGTQTKDFAASDNLYRIGVENTRVAPGYSATENWVYENNVSGLGTYMIYSSYASSRLRLMRLRPFGLGAWAIRGYTTNYYAFDNTTPLGQKMSATNTPLVLKTNGYVFKPLDNYINLGFHVKTSGNGRRKYFEYIMWEDANNFYVTPYASMTQRTNNGNAELSGRGTYDISYGSVAANGSSFSVTDALFVWDSVTRKHTIPKNTDLFVFSEGAADGFVLATNSGAGFNMITGYCDLVNSALPMDNGSVHPRWAFLIKGQDNNLATYTSTPSYTSPAISNSPLLGGAILSDLAEIYGEDEDALSTRLIYPAFLDSYQPNGYTYLMNRGQLKNIFISQGSVMQGVVGDVLIALDNSKYFNIFNNNSVAFYVKV